MADADSGWLGNLLGLVGGTETLSPRQRIDQGTVNGPPKDAAGNTQAAAMGAPQASSTNDEMADTAANLVSQAKILLQRGAISPEQYDLVISKYSGLLSNSSYFPLSGKTDLYDEYRAKKNAERRLNQMGGN